MKYQDEYGGDFIPERVAAWGGVHGLGRGGLPACNEEEYCQRDAYHYDCKGDEECFCGFI